MQVYHPQQQELKCPTCQVTFTDPSAHKLHYKSDHHRYNLKRKMVKLPPVTLDMFNSKITEKQREAPVKFECGECGKSFASAGTLKQHVSSKKHDPNMKRMVERGAATEKKPVVFVKDAKRCFFSGHQNDSVQANEAYMASNHSFFIAQRQYCKDVTGLLEYLQEKVEVGHMCITCENKGAHDFQSAEAVRRHMADKGHNFMKTDNGFEEYEKYYDFSSLFEAKLLEQENVVPGIEYQEVKVIVDEGESEGEWEDAQSNSDDGEQEGEDEEWEEIEEETEQQQGQKPEAKQKKGNKQRVKTYRIMKPTLTANDQLLLPNGKTLGHRKYRQFYKQTIRLEPWYNQLKPIGYGVPGGSGSTALVDQRTMAQMIRREQMWKRSIMRERKNALRVGMNNNGLMKYFRCQNSL